MVNYTLVLITVILLAIVLLITFNGLYAFIKRKHITNIGPARPPSVVSKLGEQCAYSECTDNLVCNTSTYTCRGLKGVACRTSLDCSTGLYCADRCTDVGYNSLHKNCPCKLPLLCTADESTGLHICKIMDGYSCKFDKDCSGQACVKGKCNSKKHITQSCRVDGECSTGNCSINACQPEGMISHTTGSSCRLGIVNDPAFCPTGDSCLAKSAAAKANIGICTNAPLELTDPCSKDGQACSGALACLDSDTFKTCTTVERRLRETNCSCRLPFPDPLTGNASRICPGLSTWSPSRKRCLYGVGDPCTTTSDCSVGKCVVKPVVIEYRIATGNDGASSLSIKTLTYTPINVDVTKYRTSGYGSNGPLHIILGQDKQLHYSTANDSLTNKPWKVVSSIGNASIVDFDCASNGRLGLLADMSNKFGGKYKTSILVTSSPNLEATLTFFSSIEYDRMCMNATDIYLLSTRTNEVVQLEGPDFKSTKGVRTGLPNGETLRQLFVPSVDGSDLLVGLTNKGFMLAKYNRSSLSYPQGVFGSTWEGVVKSCAVSGSQSGLCIVSKCMVTPTSGPKMVYDIMMLRIDGISYILPGPGGYNIVSQNVSFDDIDEHRVARVLYKSTCVVTT